MSDLLAYYQSQQDDMVTLLRSMIEHESPSLNKELTDVFGDYLQNVVENIGAEVTTYKRETVGDIRLAKWNADSPNTPILILAHIDTVWKQGTLAERPIQIDDDGRLFGSGAVDMKGGITVAISAIKGLVERDSLPDRPIWLLLTTDEEIGSRYSRDIIEELAQQVEFVLVLEPPTNDGSLKTSRKGVASFRLTINGRASHAGNEPEMGINSIIEFAQQALEINQLNDLRNGTSVSVTVVEGGTASNVIPAQTRASIDVRTVTAKAFNKVQNTLLNLHPFIPGSEVAVEQVTGRPPMERDGATFDKIRTIAKKHNLSVREDAAGGGSDGNFTAALGIPTVDGLGAEGGGLHALDEHVLIRSLPKKAALLAAILQDW